MDLQLQDKTAFVSGSTAGIGRAIAEKLIEEGASVIINGRDEHGVSQAVEEIQNWIPDADIHGLAADLSDQAGCDKVIQKLPEVDILINNVGIFEAVDFAEIPDDRWQTLFNVNVMSGVRLSRYYLPKMMESGWGRIQFISSESGINIPTEMIHYGMTKSAQLAISRGLAKLTKGSENDVTVNAILPGPTLSRGVRDFISQMANNENMTDEEVRELFFEQARPGSLIQQFAQPAEVADTAVFYCSPRASLTNGAAIRVEGGIVDTIT